MPTAPTTSRLVPMSRPAACFAVLFLVIVSIADELAAPIASDDGTVELTWMTPEGLAWQVPIATGTTASGPDPDGEALRAPRWFPPLPDLEIPLIGGGRFDVASARGKILLLDFWATWCAPCLEELPQLQALWEREKERGLVAVAVNAQEPDELAIKTAESLGLTLPIGRYTRTAHRELGVDALPTVILVGRDGRIRERWNGYVTGLEQAIADRVGALLDDRAPVDSVDVATVAEGGGAFQVRWRRDLGASAGGVGVVVASDGSPRIAVAEPGRVLTIGVDGRTRGRFSVPPEAGRLVQGDLDGNGRPQLVGFRAGGDRLAIIDAVAGRHRVLDAPATVLDVAVLPGDEDGAASRLALATVDGLFVVGVDGEDALRIGTEGRRTGVAPSGKGGMADLDRDRTVTWYDRAGAETARSRGPVDGWTLLADPGSTGIGVLPAGSFAAATGRFLESGTREVAVAGPRDQLVLVEIATGKVRFRARWPEIRALAAWDLDDDGRDELIVASGRSLTVLESAD